MLISYCHTLIFRGFFSRPHMVEIGFLAKQTCFLFISQLLVLEQPQPLLNKDYMLSKAILEYATFVSNCHSPTIILDFVSLKIL